VQAARARKDVTPTVAVVGGGISGLAAAWELSSYKPKPRVVLLEADRRLGGKIRSGTIAGHQVDLGPDAFVARREEATSLCRELGIDDELVSPGALGAFVWARGRLRPLPGSLAVGVPTRLGDLARSGILGPAGVLRASLDLLGPLGPRWPACSPDVALGSEGPGFVSASSDDCAVGEIVGSRLGGQVVRRLADPLIGGIHAGPVSTMSAGAVFPSLLHARNRPGGLMRALRNPEPDERVRPTPAPVFLAPRSGMERIVEALAEKLGERDVDLRTNVEVMNVEDAGGRWTLGLRGATVDADGLVLAVPASRCADLVNGSLPELSKLLAPIEYSSVALATMAFDESTLRLLDGTGFLVPAEQGAILTACTWMTSKWPHLRRPGEVLIRTSCGRFGDDRFSRLSDDHLVQRMVDELRPVLGLQNGPTDVNLTRWNEAFPQYRVGHPRLVQAIEHLCREGSAPVSLAGAAYHGVGIPACIGSGRRAASAVMERLRNDQALL